MYRSLLYGSFLCSPAFFQRLDEASLSFRCHYPYSRERKEVRTDVATPRNYVELEPLSGTDAFTIMPLMGHSTVTVSQRYVHLSPEAVELAYWRLAALNLQKVGAKYGHTRTDHNDGNSVILLSQCARVAKSADATDLKSIQQNQQYK
jgi:hypothetical protein